MPPLREYLEKGIAWKGGISNFAADHIVLQTSGGGPKKAVTLHPLSVTLHALSECSRPSFQIVKSALLYLKSATPWRAPREAPPRLSHPMAQKLMFYPPWIVCWEFGPWSRDIVIGPGSRPCRCSPTWISALSTAYHHQRAHRNWSNLTCCMGAHYELQLLNCFLQQWPTTASDDHPRKKGGVHM